MKGVARSPHLCRLPVHPRRPFRYLLHEHRLPSGACPGSVLCAHQCGKDRDRSRHAEHKSVEHRIVRGRGRKHGDRRTAEHCGDHGDHARDGQEVLPSTHRQPLRWSRPSGGTLNMYRASFGGAIEIIGLRRRAMRLAHQRSSMPDCRTRSKVTRPRKESVGKRTRPKAVKAAPALLAWDGQGTGPRLNGFQSAWRDR